MANAETWSAEDLEVLAVGLSRLAVSAKSKAARRRGWYLDDLRTLEDACRLIQDLIEQRESANHQENEDVPTG